MPGSASVPRTGTASSAHAATCAARRLPRRGSHGGDVWRLKVSGASVTSDEEACGTNGTLVYYAWMFEDNYRDDGGDLTTYVRPDPE